MLKRLFCLSLVCVSILTIVGCDKNQRSEISDASTPTTSNSTDADNTEKPKTQQNAIFPSRCDLQFAKTGNYVFYTDGNRNIVRESINNGEQQVLAPDYLVDIISYTQNSLYFHCIADNYIYCMDLNGSQIEKVIDSKTSWFTCFNEKLYYISGYGTNPAAPRYVGDANLYESDLAGNSSKLVISKIYMMLHCYKDFVPCVARISFGEMGIVYEVPGQDTAQLCYIDWDGNTSTVAEVPRNSVDTFQIFGDKVFYRNRDGYIYSVDLSGKNKSEIATNAKGDFIVVDNRLFYGADYGSGQKLCLMDLTALTSEVIQNGGMENPMIIDNSLLFRDSGLMIVCKIDLNTLEQKTYFHNTAE